MNSKKLYSICDRCYKKAKVLTGSFFNTDTICLDCKHIEENHPDYNLAREAEHQEVVKGNHNYEGIGLPENYDNFVTEFKSKVKE